MLDFVKNKRTQLRPPINVRVARNQLVPFIILILILTFKSRKTNANKHAIEPAVTSQDSIGVTIFLSGPK